jgi:predicted regulator of Ras-like GTPase activity (Roadblock/LC7/MglB family)
MTDAMPLKRRRHGGNWKNNVEDDLNRLLEHSGVTGAIVTSKNGDIITQAFKEVPKHRENAMMQLVKKTVQTINTMRNVPLRRVMFETDDGSVILYNAENVIIGCLLDKNYDLLSIMLEIRTVGDLVGNHLNNGELSEKELETIVNRNRDEFKTFASGFLKLIDDHWGSIIADRLVTEQMAKQALR